MRRRGAWKAGRFLQLTVWIYFDSCPHSKVADLIDLDELPNTKRLLGIDVPEMLHQYTSAAAAMSIIKSRAFWAGLPEQMNDHKELRLAYQHLSNISGFHYLRKTLNGRDGLFAKWISELDVDYFLSNSPKSFVVSLTPENDSLSQWRAYCDRSGGYCVGIPGEVISKAAAADGWFLAPCLYKHEDKEMMVNEIFDYHLERYREDRKANPKSQDEFVAQLTVHADNLMADMRFYGHFIKHESFKDEKEWRLLKSDFNPTLDQLRYASGREGIRAFVEFKFLDETHPGFPDKPRPNLGIGPNVIPDNSLYASTRFLEQLVGEGNADVSSTGSSFR